MGFIEKVAECVFETVKIVFNVLVDLLALCLLFLSFVAFWRLPFLGSTYDHATRHSNDGHDKIRYFSLMAFGFAGADILTLLPFSVCLCSWRSIYMLYFMYKESGRDRSAPYDTDVRYVVWLSFGLLFLDVLTVFAFALNCVAFWRMPGLMKRLIDESCAHGWELFAPCTTIESIKNSDGQHMLIIASSLPGHLADAFSLVICLPFQILAAVSWRSAHFIHTAMYFAATSDNERGLGFSPLARFYAFKIVFVDIPCDILSVFGFLLGHIYVWKLLPMYYVIHTDLKQHGTALWPPSLLNNGAGTTYKTHPQYSRTAVAATAAGAPAAAGAASAAGVRWINADEVYVHTAHEASRIRELLIVEVLLLGTVELFANVFTLLPFLLLLLTWRSAALFHDIAVAHAADRSVKDQGRFFSWQARAAVWNNLGALLFYDIPCIFGFLFSLLAVWRLPALFALLGEQWSTKGSPLCPGGQTRIFKSQLEANEVNTNDPTAAAAAAAAAVTTWHLNPKPTAPAQGESEADFKRRRDDWFLLHARPETEYGAIIFANFISSLLELLAGVVTAPWLVLSICSWRVFFLCRGLCDCWANADVARQDPLAPGPEHRNDQNSDTNPLRGHDQSNIESSVNRGTNAVENEQRAPSAAAARSESGAAAQSLLAAAAPVNHCATVDPQHEPKTRLKQSRNDTEKTRKYTIADVSPSNINWTPFAVIWTSAFQVIADVVMFAVFILAHASVVRIPFLYGALREHYAVVGTVLLPWTVPSREWMPPQSEYRFIILAQVAHALVEIFLLPFILLILFSVYRVKYVLKRLKEDPTLTASPVAQKLFLLEQAVRVVLDAFTLIPTAVCFLSGFRTVTYYNDIVDLSEQHSGEDFNNAWRWLSWEHFVLLFRDIVLMPFGAVVLCSLYRTWSMVSEIKKRVGRWAPVDNPAVKITEMRLQPAPGRETGAQLKIKGTKPSEFSLNEDNCEIQFYVRGDKNFWKNVGESHGGLAASIGEGMLPVVIKESWFDHSKQLKKGDVEVELLFDFDVSATLRGIKKGLERCVNDEIVVVQAEFGSHDGTLFYFKAPLREFLSSLNSNGSKPVKIDQTFDLPSFAGQTWHGEKFTEVWWRVALKQFGLILLDVVTLVFFLLLHAFPHRIIPFYARVCESPERRRNRAFVSVVDDAEEIIEHFPNEVDTYLHQVSQLLKSHAEYRTNHSLNNHVLEFPTRVYNRTLDVRTKLGHRGEDQIARRMAALLDDFVIFSESLMLSADSVLCGKFEAEGRTTQAAIEEEERKKREWEVASTRSIGSRSARRTNNNNNNNFFVEYNSTAGRAKDYMEHKTRARRDFERNLLDHDYSGVSTEITEARINNNNNDNVKNDDGDGGNGGGAIVEPPSKASKRQQMRAELYKRLNTEFPLDARDAPTVSKKAQELQEKAIDELKKIKPELTHAGACCDVKKSDGIDGVRLDLGSIWVELLLDIVPAICFCITFASVYRAPWIVRRVYRSHYPRLECMRGVAEIFFDCGYLIVFAFALPFRHVNLVWDLAKHMWFFPSFPLARLIILHQFNLIWHTIARSCSFIVSCKAIQFILASAVFGALAPGVQLEGALKQDQNETDTCAAAIILICGLFWMFGLSPLLASNAVAGKDASTPGYVYWGMILAFVIVGMICSLIHKKRAVFTLRRPVVKAARPNWHNSSNFVWIFLELVQILAIIFGLGAGAGNVLPSSGTVTDATNYVFLLFQRHFSNESVVETLYNATTNTTTYAQEFVLTPAHVPAGVSVALAVTVVFFLAATMPIVTGHILKWSDSRNLIKSSRWATIMKVLGFGLQLTVARNLTQMLTCTQADGGGGGSVNSGNSTTTTLVGGESTTAMQSDLVCWRQDDVSAHAGQTVCLMVFGVYYFVATLCHNVMYDEHHASRSDIVTAEFYRTLTSGAMVAATVLATLLQQKSQVAGLVIFLVASLWSLIWSLGLYAKLFNPEENAFCTLRLVELLKIALYFTALVASGVHLAAVKMAEAGGDAASRTSGHAWPIYVSLGTAVVAFLAAFATAEWCSSRTPDEDTIDSARKELLDLEERLVVEGKMTAAWVEMRKAWRRRVETAVRASTLAAAAMHFESGISAIHQSNNYLKTRSKWVQDTFSMIDDTEKDDDMAANKRIWKLHISRWDDDDGDDMDCCRHGSLCPHGRWCSLECCCWPLILCCCFWRESYESRDNSSDGWHDRPQNLTLLGQITQTLMNAVMADEGGSQQQQQDNLLGNDNTNNAGGGGGGGGGSTNGKSSERNPLEDDDESTTTSGESQTKNNNNKISTRQPTTPSAAPWQPQWSAADVPAGITSSSSGNDYNNNNTAATAAAATGGHRLGSSQDQQQTQLRLHAVEGESAGEVLPRLVAILQENGRSYSSSVQEAQDLIETFSQESNSGFATAFAVLAAQFGHEQQMQAQEYAYRRSSAAKSAAAKSTLSPLSLAPQQQRQLSGTFPATPVAPSAAPHGFAATAGESSSNHQPGGAAQNDSNHPEFHHAGDGLYGAGKKGKKAVKGGKRKKATKGAKDPDDDKFQSMAEFGPGIAGAEVSATAAAAQQRPLDAAPLAVRSTVATDSTDSSESSDDAADEDDTKEE